MSELKMISPMLDRFDVGGPISDHHGVRCYPAMEKDSDSKFIVKVISVPASETQMEALLLSGAYQTQDDALAYFKTLADGVSEEVNTLQKLSQLEGFLAYEDHQTEPADNLGGYNIYLLGTYKRSLARYWTNHTMTHLSALNLGLDMCAALSVCRRSGYLYVDLKPSNIFLTADNTYRIGDLGFVPLNSMKYTSLPDKYRSQYTAPEIQDAFSSLNMTMDVYALGLILYQAYNNGELPFTGDSAPEQVFNPPLYADYEMSEIILKACAPDPADRWTDPMELGQALVSYMQRNGANDTPIVPPPVPVEEPFEPEEEDTDVHTDDLDAVPTEIAETETESVSEIVPEDAGDSEVSAESVQDAVSNDVYTEDELGNLSFLLEESDETAPEQQEDEVQYEEISSEVSDILIQVDELAAHPVPDPVIPPEPIDVPVPEPTIPEEETENTVETEETDSEEEPSSAEEQEEIDEEASAEIDNAPVKKKKKRTSGHWLRWTLIGLLLSALIFCGIFYYMNYYLQPIDSIVLEGSEDTLTVHVDAALQDSLLSVVCSDPHGHQIIAPLEDGKAVFTNLVPDTAYTVKVVTDGFHKLIGYTTKAYSTPVQSNIVQFSAVTGAENGSAILSFTVDGPDSDNWTVFYSADGEEEQSALFPSHLVTLTGLTVGKEYTFRLVPEKELYVTGIEEIKFKASNLIYAEDLKVTSCVDSTLTAVWNTPADTTVDSWTVRCYNDTYNETIITSENTAVFDGLDHTQSFTVEVTAAAMSVNQRVFVPENSATITDFSIDASDPSQITLSWNSSQAVPEGGWQLRYTVDGAELEGVMSCTENSAVLPYQIPGAQYIITVSDAEGKVALGTPVTYNVAAPEVFSCTYDSITVTADDIDFYMCKRPGWKYWDRYDLDDDDYTTQFSADQQSAFLLHLTKEYGYSYDNIHTVFAIRDSAGKPVLVSESAETWNDMWYRRYCELDIPQLPSVPGEYTMSVYFNGRLAHTQDFTITD